MTGRIRAGALAGVLAIGASGCCLFPDGSEPCPVTFDRVDYIPAGWWIDESTGRPLAWGPSEDTPPVRVLCDDRSGLFTWGDPS